MSDTTALLPHIKLRFNIDHPSFEESYTFGYDCALAEISEAENPFHEGTSAYEQWQEGWWAGFYGEKPLYELNADQTAIDKPAVTAIEAANDRSFVCNSTFIINVLKITGAIAASALVGYQLLDLVA